MKAVSAVLVILALGGAVYSNSLSNKFVWDDDILIKENPYIKSWSPKIFTRDIGEGPRGRFLLYRPVQMASYMIDYFFWALNPTGYHFTNVFLHLVTAILLYKFLIMISANRAVSFVAGILFVCHPVHTGAVNYVSGRADILAAAFMLAAFISYIRYISQKNAVHYGIMIFTYIMALLSKEHSLMLPVLFIAYSVVFDRRIRLVEFSPVLIISLLYIGLRLHISGALLIGTQYLAGALERVPGIFVAITDYVRLLIFPMGLHMEYGNSLFTFFEPKAILGITITILAVLYTLANRSDRVTLFSALWVLITLVPVSNLYPLNAYMAEHWLYFPSIGVFLAASEKGYLSYKHKERLRPLIIALILFAVIFYSIQTVRQNRYWREPIEFYKKTLEFAPSSARLYNNLGAAYSARGDRKNAIASYETAIRLDPDYGGAYNNLGSEYGFLGEHRKAAASFTKALSIIPDYAKAHNNLGVAYRNMGRPDDAASSFKRAVELKADYAEAYNNLGAEYAAMGKNLEAIEAFEKAIISDPGYGLAHVNLAIVYCREKRYGQAIVHHDIAKKAGYPVDPGFSEMIEAIKK